MITFNSLYAANKNDIIGMNKIEFFIATNRFIY